MTRKDIDPFLRGYLDAALFTTDDDAPSGCDYVECGRAEEMFPQLPTHFIDRAAKDCQRFTRECQLLLAQLGDPGSVDQSERNGADFWYTRNGHGVGFWDRGYPDDVADALTAACKAFGEHDLMPEDIGQVSA